MSRYLGGGFRAVPLGQDTNFGDYLSRNTMPDVYPRTTDPFAPDPMPGTDCQPCPPGTTSIFDLLKLTMPGERPRVFQRAVNMQVTVPAAPAVIAVTNNRFECDSFLLDVPSTAANSVFFGYGAGVTTTNCLEVQAGTPILIEPENTREQWELQRQLEFIAAMLAELRGYPTLGQYRAPRVVFNAGEYFLTATAATVMSVILFSIPELQ